MDPIPSSSKSEGRTNLPEKYHESGILGEVGHKFQSEIHLYICLQLHLMGLTDFTIRFEVKEYWNFDDIYCELELNGKTYVILIQTKRKCKFEITEEILFGDDKNFGLKQYLRNIVTIKENVKLKDKNVIFIILTTAPMTVRNSEDNDVIKTVQKIFANNVFSKDERDAQILPENYLERINNTLINLQKKEMETLENEKRQGIIITEEILSNLTKKDLHDKAKYIRENLIFMTNVKYGDKLRSVNNNIMQTIYSTHTDQEFSKELFAKVLRDKVLNHIDVKTLKTQSKKEIKIRECITKAKFDELIFKSMLDVDLPEISKTFRCKIPLMIKIKSKILETIQKELQNGCNFEGNERTAKLDAVRIYDTIRRDTSKKAFVVPISKLSDKQKTWLENYEENVVIFVDEGRNDDELFKKNNLYYIGKITGGTQFPEKLTFSYNELTFNAKKQFLEDNFSIQGHSRCLKDFFESRSNSEEILERLFIEICEKGAANLGKMMEKENPSTYIERTFKKKQSNARTLKENECFLACSMVLVDGDPGMGKSLTSFSMACDYKNSNPDNWIEFVKLNSHICALFQENRRIINIKKAKKFFLKNLSTVGQNPELDREFLRHLLTDSKEPQVVLVLDEFDDLISSHGHSIVNLIEQLKRLKIKIIIPGRSHSVFFLKNNLRDFKHYEMQPFNGVEHGKFIEKYLQEMNMPENSVDRYLHNVKIMIEEGLLYNPHYLRILIDIAVKNKENELEKPSKFSTYDNIFKSSFDKYFNGKLKKILPSEAFEEMENIVTSQAYWAAVEKKLQAVLSIEKKPDEIDILRPGFTKKMRKETYSFIYKTFADYFLAKYLVKEVIGYNEDHEDILKYLTDENKIKDDSLLFRFVNEMLNQQKSKKCLLEAAKFNEIYSKFCERFNLF